MQPLKHSLLNAVDRAGTFLLSPPRDGFGQFYNYGPRSERKVALTFDDGPSRDSTERLLDVLARLDVRATFFCIGTQVEWNPELVKLMDAQGHVIGNHSMGHRRASGLKLGPDDGHIGQAAHAITQVIGRKPCLYRPPWGWLTPWEARRLSEQNNHVIGWDVYTDDWKVPEVPATEIADFACRTVQPGSIVLMHDSRSLMQACPKIEHVRAAELIVTRLRAEGYQFATIPELLGIPAYSAA